MTDISEPFRFTKRSGSRLATADELTAYEAIFKALHRPVRWYSLDVPLPAEPDDPRGVALMRALSVELRRL